MNKGRPILLVEDDMVDAMTVERALKEVSITNEIQHVKNGEEAIEYLNNINSSNVPALILLDLNMPVMNGVEFLKERLMHGERYKHVPVIVLTTSTDNTEIKECFNNSIAGYMVKPIEFHEFVKMIKSISSYWTLSESY